MIMFLLSLLCVVLPVTYKDISDEWYLRQRTEMTLGELLPHLTATAWVSPSALVIGDVDLLDRVRDRRRWDTAAEAIFQQCIRKQQAAALCSLD